MKKKKKNNEITARMRIFINKMKSRLKNDKMRRVKFLCPKCNSESISITFNKLLAEVKCLTCSLSGEIKIKKAHKPIDFYNDFMDLYHADEEIQRLEKNIELLKKQGKWGELKHTYSILSELYRAKGACLLKDGNNPGPYKISNWNLKYEKYKG